MRIRRLAIVLTLLGVMLIPFVRASAAPQAATLTVDTTSDTLAADGECSLREAITAVNTNLSVDACTHDGSAGMDTINFNISGAGPHFIFIGPLGLPTITEPVHIDGYSESDTDVNSLASGTDADIRIVLNGSSATSGASGLTFKPDSNSNPNASVVEGLVIQEFPADGIRIENVNSVQIFGNFIGTNRAGTADVGNEGNGISIINGDTNEVGDRFTGVATRNLISGNEGYGIFISGFGSTGNIVEVNLIGTNAAGLGDIGNTGDGVHIEGASGTAIGGSVGTTPGGACTGSCNLISGNGDASAAPAILSDGIQITGQVTSANFVQGNIIGMNVTGTAPLANSGEGVLIDRASNQQVGGTTPAARNLLSGNGGDGVEIDNVSTGALSPDNNSITGNFIGTDATGTLDFGNGSNGVAVLAGFANKVGGTTGTTAGGACTGACNLLSGNSFDGISIAFTASATIVQGNFIGTDVNGTTTVGNTFEGININGPANLSSIGSSVPAARNIIAGNGSDGIEIQGSSAVSNTITGNFIGTTTAGTVTLTNADDGVFVSGANNNTVGGTSGTTPGGACTGNCNVISGNTDSGVHIKFGGTGNQVLGNFIGVAPAGTSPLANGVLGVFIEDSPGNTVGGTTAAGRNIISGNTDEGVGIDGDNADSNVVQGNFIGTDTTGGADIGNGQDGVEVSGGNGNRIGGTTDTTPGGSCTGMCNLISGNSGNGVVITTDSTAIEGNFIGIGVNGNVDIGNDESGVIITSPAAGNTVGGTTANARNVISGNDSHGVSIVASGATGNFVQGNYIGVQTDGVTPLSNATDGVSISGGATLNQIGGETGVTLGGACTGACNVISANDSDGVDLGSNSNIVLGNFIGTDVTGLLDRGNNFYGVLINDAASNTVGGTVSGARNVISGNTNDGILIQGATSTNNAVLGNYIGAATNGTAALPNTFNGVYVLNGPANYIGSSTGTTAGSTSCTGGCNLISGNGMDGVEIDGPTAAGNVVAGNFIGVQANGASALGNGVHGVSVKTAGNRVGGGYNTGTTADANVISQNGDGVVVDTADGNAIRYNSIFANTGAEIDLQNGGNNNQAAPVLSVSASESTYVHGTLTSTPDTNFALDFYYSPACAEPEGKTYLGSQNVTTDGGGNVAFIATLPVNAPVGSFVTGTATDPNNNTSEFSACVQDTLATPTPIPCPYPPELLKPGDGAIVNGPVVRFKWTKVPCATRYQLRIRRDSPKGTVVFNKKKIKQNKFDVDLSASGAGTYYWRVIACDGTICSSRSERWHAFTLE